MPECLERLNWKAAISGMSQILVYQSQAVSTGAFIIQTGSLPRRECLDFLLSNQKSRNGWTFQEFCDRSG